MSDDLQQGMLFGTLASHPQPGPAEAARGELRICTLNVQSTGTARAQPLLDWLAASGCNILVLTELRPGDGGRLLLAGLEAEGFGLIRTAGWQDSRHITVIATTGLDATPADPAPRSPRIAAADITTAANQVRIIGVYAPANGMTADSSLRRRDFQDRFLDWLDTAGRPATGVFGDLNVVEPGHRPALPGFEDHDYAFYTGLTGRGLRDAYRTLHPDGTDHSWTSPQAGNQRLDHSLVSAEAGTVRECRYDHSTRHRRLTDHSALLTTVVPGVPA